MKKKVKNLEIYRMPDGKDYFAARGQKGTYFLYPVENCAEPPAYQITSEGQIKHWVTDENCFLVNQLEDTGRKFDCVKNQPEEEGEMKETPAQPLLLMMLGDFFYGGK